MIAENEPLRVDVQVSHTTDGTLLGSVPVESVDASGEVAAQAMTGTDGRAVLEIPADRWNQQLSVRVVGQPGSAASLSRDELNGTATAALTVVAGRRFGKASLALLADQLVATRRVRADDLASDLAAPSSDSLVRLLPPADRARMLSELGVALLRTAGDSTGEAHLVDPDALREGHVKLVPLRDLPIELDPVRDLVPDFEQTTKPGVGWEQFGWSLADDQSYRDYLRSVFVLFVHQQKLGAKADPTTFPATVERQLRRRFFQNFRTTTRTEVALNRLLLPIVTAILTAPVGPGFGFGLAPASLPVKGTRTDREQLDALLAMAPVSVQEFANRYRLPLTEPDSAVSSPVLLNIFTLSRALSDTAQGPIEPPDNVIQPQLPGEEGKTILWKEVVGSAPFFLRFDEWLARQQPFFAENLFALRTQVESVANGPWLTDRCKTFLTYHQGLLTSSITSYDGYFATMSEVHRSATYLLAYAAADAKLAEVVRAIDTNDFAAADRLANDAERLLQQAHPDPRPGEDWQPEFWVGTTEPLSLARRRKVKVSNITELVGSGGANPVGGLERFYALSRPYDLWKDVYLFRKARDQATRLQTYQSAYLLPLLRAMIRTGLGDLPGAVDVLAGVTGFFIGTAMLGSAAGMTVHPEAGFAKRVVAGRLRWTDELGDRPYTARLMYDDSRDLELPYPLTPQLSSGFDVLKAAPAILHPLEERYARLVQGDALLAWAEALYRTDDASSLERARELYKAVIFLHGEDPGTSAYAPFHLSKPWFSLVENPRRRSQVDRARLALHQLEAGLNFYGYSDDAVPTLSYDTLVGAAQRWATGAKTAQTDYLAYLSRVEQLDLDLLAAKAQERKARATVAITAEVIEIAKAGVVVAQKLVTDVQKLIAAKQAEIADANSLFSQFKDYFSGMKSSVSSMIDVGKSASEGYSALSGSSAGDALGIGANSGAGGAGAGGGAGGEAAGLGSAAGGLAVVGGFAAFAVLSTITLQGMADAATKRQGDLMALTNEALPAAQAGVRVQERNVTIANLQAQIAATDLAYARDLVNYQNERFLNRDFWDALAGVARHALHRYLDLSGQAAWFAERALAYRLATTIRVVRIGYFDPRMRDIGGVDRLALDLAELEAMRLGAARLTVPLTRTYSLARDLPLAFGQLKASGRCTFALTDDDLMAAHPGTYAHRIRAVDVAVDAPGTVVPTRGMLTNGGFSLLRRAPGAPPVPLLRFADAYPVSEFRLRSDMALYGMPGEQLMPFEGAGFSTTWTLELPPQANAHGLHRITDVRITFDIQAGYDVPAAAAVPGPQPTSRAMFVSALAVAPEGLKTLRDPAKPVATVVFGLDRLAVPDGATITNVAVMLPGVAGGSVEASLAFKSGPKTPFTIDDGLAMSNTGPLSDGIAANDQPLNAAASGSPARPVTLKVTKGGDSARLASARDAMLWIEYSLP